MNRWHVLDGKGVSLIVSMESDPKEREGYEGIRADETDTRWSEGSK